MDSRNSEKVMEETGERNSKSYLLQIISMTIERGNAACISAMPPDSLLIFTYISLMIYSFVYYTILSLCNFSHIKKEKYI